MHFGLGYLDHHGWSLLRSTPLKLTQGNIEENLDAFMRNGIVEGVPFCNQMQNILMWYATRQQQTIAALETLRDAPCSIGLMEKGHGPGSVLRGKHKRVGYEQLQMRPFISMNAPLFKSSKVDAKIQKVRDELHTEWDSQPKIRFTAQNAFRSELANKRRKAVKRNDTYNWTKGHISQHNALFRALSPQEQHEFELVAAEERSRRMAEANLRRARLFTELNSLLAAKLRDDKGIRNAIDLRRSACTARPI